MTPQELKNSILQLAIQGKLVEQRPEEGTAEELYQQIQQEKQALIKAGKIKKEKLLPEITEDEIPFELPTTWKWMWHNQLYEIIGGSQPPKEHFVDTPLPNYVRLYQIRDYGEKPVPVYVNQNEVTKFTKKGDILLARYGGSVGKVFWAENGAYNVALARVAYLYTGEHVDTRYLFYYYLAPLYQMHVKNNTRSAQAGFNKEDLDKLLFPLPPLAEQKRIVAKIEELLPLIDRYEAAWTRLEEFNKRFPGDMQKSILQMAIQGKLVEQRPEEGTGEELYQQIQKEKQALIKAGKIKKEKPLPEITMDEIPFEIPESWKWTALGNIIWYIDAGKSPNCERRSVTDTQWGVITTTAIQLGRFDDEQNKVLPFNYEVNKSMQVKKGDILITRAGPTNRTGIACVVKLVRYNLILSDKTLRINMTNNFIDKDYIIMLLNSPEIRKLIVGLMSGMDRQQVNISQDKYKTLAIPLPPLAEQKRIVAKLEELLPLCDGLKK